jgi:hypothetical protein
MAATLEHEATLLRDRVRSGYRFTLPQLGALAGAGVMLYGLALEVGMRAIAGADLSGRDGLSWYFQSTRLVVSLIFGVLTVAGGLTLVTCAIAIATRWLLAKADQAHVRHISRQGSPVPKSREDAPLLGSRSLTGDLKVRKIPGQPGSGDTGTCHEGRSETTQEVKTLAP